MSDGISDCYREMSEDTRPFPGVRRFHVSGEVLAREGDMVLYADYAALRAKLEAAEARLAALAPLLEAARSLACDLDVVLDPDGGVHVSTVVYLDAVGLVVDVLGAARAAGIGGGK